MAVTLAEAVVYFRGDKGQLVADLDDAEKKSESSGANMGKAIGASIAGGLVAAGVALTGFGIKATEQFADFQSHMNEVFTLLPGITQKGMDDMTGQVKDFAKQFGVLPEKVVPALYQALSAGVPPNNVFKFLETAQKAAKGGVSSLETSVNGLSSVVNAYGADVLDAGKASDLMFTTVRLGKTNFEELSASLFNVVPTAASLKLEFGNVTAALAAMTLQGVPTSVATTQLRQLLVELSQAGSSASKTFKAAAGESFPEFIAAGHNLQDALKVMEGAAQDSNLRISNLFSSVEAGNAALALTGTGAKTFGDDLAAMGNSAGATQNAFDTMQKGLTPIWDKIKATWATTMLDIGEKLAPIVEESLPAFQAAVGSLGGMITTVFGWVVLGVKALQTAWNENWGGMRDKAEEFMTLDKDFEKFWQRVHQVFQDGEGTESHDWAEWLANGIGGITQWIRFVLDALGMFFEGWHNTQVAWHAILAGDWDAAGKAIWKNFTGWAEVLLNYLQIFWKPEVTKNITGALSDAWEGLKSIWKDIAAWWNSTIGALTGQKVSVPAAQSNAVVNPANTPNAPYYLNTPIFAPGQPQIINPAAQGSGNILNVHPGAIVINDAGDPQKNADAILKALISIHEGMNP